MKPAAELSRTPGQFRRTDHRPALCAGLACVTAALVTGCATPGPGAAFAPVEKVAREHLDKQLSWPRTEADRQQIDRRVAELLARPLSADDAVQLALLNNRGLEAAFEELGIGQADLLQAGRLPNPGFSVARLRRGDEVEIEIGLHFSLARLLAMPLARPLQERRLQQTQGAVAMQVLALAADTRKAWVLAVAAEETVRYTQQVQQAAAAGAELARRMEQVGNFNKLARAREQGFEADAALALARAEQAQRAARERLIRLLGLWGGQTQFSLPPRLPELPAQAVELPDVERTALAQRLDVQGARLASEQAARELGLARATRFVDGLELGAGRNRSNEAPTQRGWELGFELPLFDGGGARIARAEAVAQRSAHQAAHIAIEARSEVREAYTAYRSAYDIARHHAEVIVPLRRLIADENLLRYNGMLIGVFELLADARLQIASVNAAIEARRDFWIAQADLDMALIGKPSLAMATGLAGSAAASQPGGADH